MHRRKTKFQLTKIKAGIKRRAEKIEERTQQILGTELRNISDGVAANLPSLETLRRNVRHSRQDRNMPPTPAHKEDICHRRIVPRQMEIPFWCMIAVLEMKREFLFSYHRKQRSFWQIQNIGMLMVHSGSVRRFSSNCILYMVSVTEEFFLVSSHFCQIKTKHLQ